MKLEKWAIYKDIVVLDWDRKDIYFFWIDQEINARSVPNTGDHEWFRGYITSIKN